MTDISHYCIVRSDLPHGVQSAYLIHAAGESSPGDLPPDTRAVALLSRDEAHLREVAAQLEASGVPHSAIEEEGILYSVGLRPAPVCRKSRRTTARPELVA